MATVFGTPLDVAVSVLAIETFYPAAATTAQVLRDFAAIEDKGRYTVVAVITATT